MADQAFQRTPIYPLEKPIADDINQGFSQADRSLREYLYQFYGKANGFVQGSFLVTATGPASLNVVIASGLAFYDNGTDVPTAIGGVIGVDDRSRYKPIVLSAPLTIAVPAPPGSNSRIDLIEVAYSRLSDNAQSRQFLNTTTDAFAPALVSKTLDFNVDATLAYYTATAVPTTALAYKSGVAGASPSPPATDTGYMAIAYITVATGVTSIVSGNIADERALLGQRGLYLGTQIITANGTYTPTAFARRCRVRAAGGGGGGGGAAMGANNAAAGGGASGAYVEASIISAGNTLTGGAVAIGTSGAGGVGVGSGTDGGDTTVVINGVTLTAKGGKRGHSAGSVAGTNVIVGGAVTAGSTAGDFNVVNPGGPGISVGGGDGQIGGNGGSTPLGGGGTGGADTADGGNGNGFGSGGGGAAIGGAGAGADKVGGAGSAGVVLIDEYT